MLPLYPVSNTLYVCTCSGFIYIILYNCIIAFSNWTDHCANTYGSDSGVFVVRMFKKHSWWPPLRNNCQIPFKIL